MGAGLPHTPTRPWQAERLCVSSDRNVDETWLHRDRTESVCSSARRTSQVARSHRNRGTEEPATRPARANSRRAGPGLGGWRRVGLLGPRQNLNLPRQAGATQERCRSWRRRISTSTVPDLVERMRFEVLVPLQPASHAGGCSPQRPKRRSGRERIRDFAGNGSCGVGIPAR